ncbi:MAG: SH3 domain-containing protein [Oscillospiraceae bacterium]|nr:SH3 domain-containing protein [Oscillospiraceae bacterium]
MTRKVLIFALALVLMVGMIPMTAFAASDFKTSEAGIDLIKDFEGFYKYPYWDYKQWTVGYGTLCPEDKLEEYTEKGITKAEAQKLLEKEIVSYETSVNKFIDKYDLKMNQQQFDALVSFTYNVGGGWTSGASSQLFTQYVIAGKTGNDFIFAISLWSNAGNSMNIGLVNRRLKEANLYLNGIYSNELPDNYGYVKFNHTDSVYEGKTRTIKLQGYDSSLTNDLQIRPEGVKSGMRFLGWYTASTGGEWIDTLTSKQFSKTLYAHWQEGEGNVDSKGNIQGTEAKYSRTASGALKIYAQPDTSAQVTGTIAKGTKMTFVADYVDEDGVKWGRLEQGGWVCLETATSAAPVPTPPAQEKVIATGTVKSGVESLNIRAGAGTSYDKVGSLKGGARVEIYEIKGSWGRIAQGWISLNYVNLDTEEEEKPEENVPQEPAPEEPTPEVKPETVVAKGLVSISSGNLNVRKGAGTSYDQVGSIANGTKVELYEIVTVDGVKWGRVSNGWISLDYVKLASTGIVTANSVNVRKGAGTSYDVAGSCKKDEVVYVYETAVVGSSTWGHTDKGWLNMKYVQMDKTSADSGSSNAGSSESTSSKGSTGYITADSANIRKGAGNSYDVVGTYKKNDVITVYETKKLTSSTWGRTNKGWINLKYAQMDADTTPVTGTITASSLNIRKGAGSSYDKVGSYAKGDKVSVYQTMTVSSVKWGRTDKGWINMAYVQTGSQSTSTTVSRTGTVNTSSLVVRKGAGTGYDKVGSVKSGEKLTITQLKLVSGTPWGKISSGWVCLDYVKMNKPSSGAPALILGDDLNIRKGAGKSYSVVGQYDKGDVVNILETKTVSGTTWGRTSKGWVSMEYVL